MALHDRLRPWHALLLAVFLLSAGTALLRDGAVTVATALGAILYALFVVVLFQFTVGNARAYAVEYRNAGGRWSDLPFLAPVLVGVLFGVTVLVTIHSLGAAVWSAFWGFVVVAAVTAVAVWLLVGYHEASESAG